MKPIKLILFLFISSLGLAQINADSTIVKNKVKEVRIFNSNSKLVTVTKYDEKGKKIFNSSDRDYIKTSEATFYNDNGTIHKTVSTHSSYPDESTIWINEYDKNQNIIKIKDEKENLVFEFSYDDRNRKEKEIMYEENKISQTILFEYLDNGNQVVQNIKGNFLRDRKNISFFDNNKNEIKSESYDSGKLRFSTNSIYDKNKIIKIIYNEKIGKTGNNFYYDAKNRLIKRQLFDLENGKEVLGKYEIFEYLENDLISNYTENIYSMTGSLEKYKFEYDFYN